MSQIKAEEGATQHHGGEKVKVTFENLEFEVNIKVPKDQDNGKKASQVRQKILKGVTGYALPGEAMFIMGASGAGKTSLLNMLCDRISTKGGSTVSGTIMANDTLAIDQNVFGHIGAYVMQDDILFYSFTPRQALTFAARLKLRAPIKV